MVSVQGAHSPSGVTHLFLSDPYVGTANSGRGEHSLLFLHQPFPPTLAVLGGIVIVLNPLWWHKIGLGLDVAILSLVNGTKGKFQKLDLEKDFFISET